MDKFLGTVCLYCADQNPNRDRSRGITRYTWCLLSHLHATASVKLMAVVSKSSFAIPDGIERVTLPFASDHLLGRLAADHLHPLSVRQAVDIWHYPKGFLPLARQVKAKKVGTIADVILQYEADHHPEARSRLAFAYWLGVLKRSIQNLDLILTVSEFSKRAILEFCDRHQLKCPPIVVTYEGVELARPEAAASASKEDYVVHLASRLSTKGTPWLLEQWLDLSKETKDLPTLKLIGELDARAATLFSKMKNVSFAPPLPREQLEELIAKSRALLLPSEIEGFGIPAVEAYLLGTPVAYIKATAVEEILGNNSPGGFHRERDSFQVALNEVLNMDRVAIANKGAALKLRYNWNDCVRRTLAAYATLL
jgi:glycosyltransferase involved in cell wall biosynthesis